MPDLQITPALAVIVFGLVASLGWGIADFGGGLASRRAPVLGVLLWSQVASLAVGLPIAAASGEPAMRPLDVGIATLCGVLGASGLALLYRGLAVGRMGVVAPIAAVLTAILPVVFGFVVDGVPSIIAIVGIALAIVGVTLVSRSPGTADDRPSGIWYAVGAGVIFASFAIAASQLGEGILISPVVVIRVASITTVVTWIVVRHAPWRVDRRLLPALLVIGMTDMLATAAYLSSIAIGPLAIAAILASLYPVVTTIIAALVLRERISPVHATGIAAAIAAVALIAGASAG